MGLTKVAVNKIGTNFDIKWQDIIRCEDMSNDILMVKKKMDNGCIVNINKKQCVAICQDGKIVDATTEIGTYIFDDSKNHIFNSATFGKDFESIWNENQYNVDEDCVIFFNLKKIIDNKFILENPIEYTDINNKLFLIKGCDIKYSLIISNPAMFFNEAPKDLEIYRKGRLNKNLKIYVEQSIRKLFSILQNKVESVNEIEKHPEIVQKIIEDEEIDEPLRKNGINIIELNIENISFSRKYRKKGNNVNQNQTPEINDQQKETKTIETENNLMQKKKNNKELEIIEGIKEIEKLKIEEVIDNKEENKKIVENEKVQKEEKNLNIVDQLENLFADE